MSGVSGRITGFTGWPAAAEKSGLAIGMNERGHVTTKRELKPTPSYSKGKLQKRVQFVREIVKEVVGLAPYEKRVVELLKVGKEKRALKVCKGKLGSHKRAKSKREDMSGVLRAMRMKQ